MKYIYEIFIFIETLFLILSLFHLVNDIAFLLIFLSLIFLLALSSRSLSYLFFNKNDKKTFSFIVIDFIIKTLSLLLCPIIYFKPKLVLGILNATFILILIFLLFVLKDKLIINLTLPSLKPNVNSLKLSTIVLFGYISYLGSIALIWFPDYTDMSTIYIFFAPLILAITNFIVLYNKLIMNYIDKAKSKRYKILWTILYFLDISFFCFVKYILHIETPLSIFTIIGLLIMLPYINSCVKIIRNQIKNSE